MLTLAVQGSSVLSVLPGWDQKLQVAAVCMSLAPALAPHSPSFGMIWQLHKLL